MTAQPPGRTVDSLVIDAGPFITSSFPVLHARARHLFTVPKVIAEIKDERSKQALGQWKDSLTVRAPGKESISFISSFAKLTGDYSVLSATDIHLLALTYELECELNMGDWRLRKRPGQPRINGAVPEALQGKVGAISVNGKEEEVEQIAEHERAAEETIGMSLPNCGTTNLPRKADREQSSIGHEPLREPQPEPSSGQSDGLLNPSSMDDIQRQLSDSPVSDSSDEEGWITPSNIAKVKARDAGEESLPSMGAVAIVKAACATNDFAMQNVMLQIGLNLVSVESAARIKKVKSWVLRCHGCFKLTRDMNRQFCPSCGGPTLLRTACSTDSEGHFRVYLKKNMQWNNRGARYSIPKTQHGSASMKGVHNLILREDQKEYTQAKKQQDRRKEVDLFDRDRLPGILTGERAPRARIEIGQGKRNPNQVRRKRK